MKDREHIALGVIALAVGAMVCAIALGILPVDPSTVHAPHWVIALIGGVFVCGGLAINFKSNELLVSVLGNIIVVSFAAVAAWIALHGSADQFSGGIPFVPHALNVKVARIVFGGCAVLCVLMLVPGVKHVVKLLSAPPPT